MEKHSRAHLEDYLTELYGQDVHIISIEEMGRTNANEPKKFGYGTPHLLRFLVGGQEERVVLESMPPNSFGHDHFSDRAQILLWSHSCFGALPSHVRSLDAGAFLRDGNMISLGKAEEFFILNEFVEGEGYNVDLQSLLEGREPTTQDVSRAEALGAYLARIHSVRMNAPSLYVRRIRDLLGHGECIMGLIDNYPAGDRIATPERLQNIERECERWRWRIKGKSHRLCQVHGDFHPWNILFREGMDFTVLDRSRGEWGEPADDVSSLLINYLFLAIRQKGRIEGIFEQLLRTFWDTYMTQTGDHEMPSVMAPFLAWRGLVLAHPVWYPDLSESLRCGILRFIENILASDSFEPENAGQFLELQHV